MVIALDILTTLTDRTFSTHFASLVASILSCPHSPCSHCDAISMILFELYYLHASNQVMGWETLINVLTIMGDTHL